MIRRVFALATLLAASLLTGCMSRESEMLGAPVEGYNHTSAAINRFTVNGAGGPNLGPYSGGGGQVCCGSVPRYWRPGLRAIVEWEKDPSPQGYASWPERLYSEAWNKRMDEHRRHYTHHRAVVEIHQYDRPGPLKVHFLPCDQIRVTAAGVTPNHPDYPYKFPRKMEDKECPKP
ncbi:hypothetical protein DNK06_17060 [Pseudomonas daroniae]|uniref:DUF3304 domain-containing protein n=1 Tax=Phytopseudomonas daroniae TaxID=2487519 RepID=A0A4Q9QJ09_9GAMM|nr:MULTISPECIES: DUF3304 domain-containing protein [Pseudomonas]TBU76581.1 hypothetical protein DNK06_17060 [Pseudomonas daroniae]TBU80874.1 hypothetical protein DNK31_15155 [Pseudomonas sp. FRB 228]TBU90112.1 hypothetical protein DNJ99_14045 [Pseudomonas daroniae]